MTENGVKCKGNWAQFKLVHYSCQYELWTRELELSECEILGFCSMIMIMIIITIIIIMIMIIMIIIIIIISISIRNETIQLWWMLCTDITPRERATANGQRSLGLFLLLQLSNTIKIHAVPNKAVFCSKPILMVIPPACQAMYSIFCSLH